MISSLERVGKYLPHGRASVPAGCLGHEPPFSQLAKLDIFQAGDERLADVERPSQLPFGVEARLTAQLGDL